MNDGSTRQAASWHTDPLLGPPRLRWWTGDHWTAWIVTSPVDPPSVAWRPALGELPPPICWGTAVLRVAVAPPLHLQPLVADPPVAGSSVVEAPGELAAPDLDASTGAPDQGARRRPRRRLVLVAAVLVLVVGLAAAASALLLADHPSSRRHAAGVPVSASATGRSVGTSWW